MKNIKQYLHTAFILGSFLSLVVFQAQAQTAQESYQLANQAFHQQNYATALNHYKQAIKKDPQFAPAYHNLGSVQYIMNDYANALENYSQAIALNPNGAEPYASRGALYFGLRKYNEALQDFGKALNINPALTGVRYMRGQVYEAMQNVEKACQEWRQAAAHGHELARQKIIEYCGNEIGQRSGQSEASMDTRLNTALNYIKQGEQKMEQRKYQEAIQHFDQALRTVPDLGKAYFGRASAKFAMGKQEEACADWRLALKNGFEAAAEMLELGCGE